MKKIVRKTGRYLITGFICVFILLRLTGVKKKSQEKLEALTDTEIIIPVFISKVRDSLYTQEHRFFGRFIPLREIHAVSEARGQVEKVFRINGEWVKEGEVLITLKNEITEKKYSLAKERLEKAKKDLERLRNLGEGEAISASRLEEARLSYMEAELAFQQAHEEKNKLTVRAPATGFLEELLAEGVLVQAGMQVALICDQSKLKFRLFTKPETLSLFSPGRDYIIRPQAWTDKICKATCISTSPRVNTNGKMEVLLLVDIGPEANLRSGMTGELSVSSKPSRHLVIPGKAVIGSLDKAQVFQVSGQEVFLRDVKVYSLGSDLLGIKEGLQEKDTVVTTGQINLSDSAKIRIMSY